MEESKRSQEGEYDGEGEEREYREVITGSFVRNVNEKDVESEHLKNVIVSLSSKIVTTNDLEKEIQTFTTNLRSSEDARAQLQSHLSEAGSNARQRAQETHERETNLNQDIHNLKTEVDRLENTVRERDQTIHDKDFTISQRDKEITTLNIKLEDLKEMKTLNDKYVDAINDAEQKRVDLQKDYNKCLDDHHSQLEYEHAEREKLLAENKDLSKKLKDALFKIDQQEQYIHELENRLKVLDEITVQRDKLLRDLKDFQASRDKLFQDVENLKGEFEAIRKQDQLHFSQIHEQKSEVENVLRTREQRITELETKIYEINSVVHKLRQEVDSTSAECNRLKDVETQLIKSSETQEEYTKDRNVLRKELEKASDFMVDLEEKVHKANSTSVTLLNKVKESEREVDVLKDYIYELKSRVAIYIPVRDDPIDKKLAEYINNYPDRSKFKIMFMRESSGIYQFGSRKIYVRVEKDRIIIRVGGGYLTIDEFLDIYTPMELEKIERKGMNRKMAVQRTLVGRELREESPVRSSPTKSSPVRSFPTRSSPVRVAKRKSPKKSPQKSGV